jgi:hypothetical protein
MIKLSQLLSILADSHRTITITITITIDFEEGSFRRFRVREKAPKNMTNF